MIWHFWLNTPVSTKNVDFAGRIVYDEKGVEVFNFWQIQRNVGQRSAAKKTPAIIAGFLNGDFTLNTKNVLTKIRLRESGLTTK